MPPSKSSCVSETEIQSWRVKVAKPPDATSPPSSSVQHALNSIFKAVFSVPKNVLKETGTFIKIFINLPKETWPASPARRVEGCLIRGRDIILLENCGPPHSPIPG